MSDAFKDKNLLENKSNLLCEVFSCISGKGLRKRENSDELEASKEAAPYQILPENVTFIIHAGYRIILTAMVHERIKETYIETDKVRLFLDGMLGSPETLKYLSKKNGVLSFYKYSSLKPKSADDLTVEKIREFLELQIDGFLNFIYEKDGLEDKERISKWYKSILTDDIILDYRNKTFVLESSRLSSAESSKAPYVNFYGSF